MSSLLARRQRRHARDHALAEGLRPLFPGNDAVGAGGIGLRRADDLVEMGVGVEIEARKKIQVVKARREVVIAASAVNSPKLLMLSGIGPAEELKRNGVDVIANRPGVGRNLQDHLELYIQQESLHPITLNSVFNPFSKALIGAWFLIERTLL